MSRVVKELVSLSAGVLLGTALLHVLPEAFESQTRPQALFGTLLGGLLFFWLLEKVELYRHVHHHEGDGHDHHHHFDAQQAGRGGLSVLVGDSIHNFCDGIIIAAAFLADTGLGVVTALAIVAHEIPQEAGDYIVLLNAGFSRRKALLYNALSGLAAVAGGVLGYFLVGPWEARAPVPAGGRVQQLHLRGGGRSAAAAAAAPVMAPDPGPGGLAGCRPGPGAAGARHAEPRALSLSPATGGAASLGPVQRTTSTGSVLCVSTFCVSLPSSSAADAAPAVRGHHDEVAALRLGVVEDRLPGVQRFDGVAWQVTPAAAAASRTALTRSLAMRSWASKNSCGGTGCISEMAL